MSLEALTLVLSTKKCTVAHAHEILSATHTLKPYYYNKVRATVVYDYLAMAIIDIHAVS